MPKRNGFGNCYVLRFKLRLKNFSRAVQALAVSGVVDGITELILM